MINIAVLFGGKSVEHEVSVITAMQALSVISEMRGYRAIPIYITKDGTWYTGDRIDNIEKYKNIPKLLKECKPVSLVPSRTPGVARLIDLGGKKTYYDENVSRVDLVFPIIHGSGGEDGTLQGMLDLLGVPYIGCGALSSAVTMDKTATKLILKSAGIPQLPGRWFFSEHVETHLNKIVRVCERNLLYPMIVKPADIGSSVGVRTAKNTEELCESIQYAARFSSKVIVEYKLEDNLEINISVLGDRTQQKLSVCEHPLSASEILTYEDKYMASSGSKGMSAAKRQIPAEIPAELQHTIEEIARNAFIQLDCAGVVRIDFLVDRRTMKPYLCELNTIPGSLSFYLWEATGMNFEMLISELIGIAFKGQRRKNRIVRSIDSNLLSEGNVLGIKK